LFSFFLFQKSNSEFRDLLSKGAERSTGKAEEKKKSALEASVEIAARNAKKKEEAKKKSDLTHLSHW
jgi:hypothetical protein